MDQLMQANLQIIELLGAVFEEAERHGVGAGPGRPDRPARVRASGSARVGNPRLDDAITATSCATAMI